MLSFSFLLWTSFAPGPALAGPCPANRAVLTCNSPTQHTQVAPQLLSPLPNPPSDYGTCGAGHDYDQSQDVWTFTCGREAEVSVELSDLSCNVDLFVLQGVACDNTMCLSASTNGATSAERAAFSCVPGELYSLVVERYDAAPSAGAQCNVFDAFEYSLNVDCAEECTDGIDNDADGLVDCHDADCPACFEECTDGIDNDFDGLADCDDAECARYPHCCDRDGDGYASATSICGGDDCNDDPDDGAAINPGAQEQIGNGTDDDCDGLEICYEDQDGDGWGAQQIATSSLNCDGVGVAARTGDCDDTSADVSPDALDVAGDGIDQDCDGVDASFQILGMVPGRAGRLNQIRVEGATPRAVVHVVGSTQPGTTSVPGCPTSVSLATPVVLDTVRANRLGIADLFVHAPTAASGRTIYLQAVESSSCTVSDRFEITLP